MTDKQTILLTVAFKPGDKVKHGDNMGNVSHLITDTNGTMYNFIWFDDEGLQNESKCYDWELEMVEAHIAKP